MKKLHLGLLVVLLAAGTMAFTKPAAQAKETSFAWFQTDGAGNVIEPTDEPPFQAEDPNGCPNSGLTGCSKAFDGSELSGGVYSPTGALEITHKKP